MPLTINTALLKRKRKKGLSQQQLLTAGLMLLPLQSNLKSISDAAHAAFGLMLAISCLQEACSDCLKLSCTMDNRLMQRLGKALCGACYEQL